MGKFNKPSQHTILRTGGPVKTNPASTVRTYNGAAGYEYETLSQLFLLACSNMVNEDTFYESGKVRDARYSQLILKAVDEGHSEWVGRFLPWLRNQANMRSAAIVGAVEAAIAMVTTEKPGSRNIINSVLVRADEPGEMLAYFISNYGRSVPKPIKRGIADAVVRLYTQRSALKYDTASHGYRFGDVLELVHAAPGNFEQGDLFKWLITRGKKRDAVQIPTSLDMIVHNALLRREAAKHPQVLLNAARLSQAGMTWEDVLSLGGSKLDKAALWTAMIPNMGYMALLRNLRNFDEAGIKGDLQKIVQQRLMNADEVARSRQLPMRFLSAHRNVPSNTWAHALEVALDLCLGSLPVFHGHTLILIDTSGSMGDLMSGRSQLKLWEAATIFGLALAQRCDYSDVVTFSSSNRRFPQIKGESLLKGIDRFRNGYFYGGGTNTASAVRNHYQGHDRVVILTDEQADPNSGIFAPIPRDKVAITFNLAGYKAGHAATGVNRITIGGLSDAAWTVLPALESRAAGQWPF